MQTTDLLVSQPGMSSLQRPRYGAGLLLEAEDLTAGVDYTRGLIQLLVRHLFGCGVVCGLEVSAKLVCQAQTLEIKVALGLALDCAGNPIHVTSPVTLVHDPHEKCKPMPPTVWVTACYVEKCCRPKDVACSPDEDESILHTRMHDGFVIAVYGTRPRCACGCKADVDENEKPKATPVELENGTKCECYTEQNEGKCSCVCDCECVLLAEIDTTRLEIGRDDKRLPIYKTVESASADEKKKPLRVITRDVRKIRPLLTGFLPCLERAKPTPPTTTGVVNGGGGGEDPPANDGGGGGETPPVDDGDANG